jgi:hypothetical protein
MESLITLNGITPSKATAEQIRQDIFQRVESGELDPIRVNAAIKFYEKIFSGDDKKSNGLSHLVRPFVVDEIEKDKTRTEYYGFKVEIKEAGARYDFSVCNDPEWTDLNLKKIEIDEKIKEREKFLKGFTKPMPIVTEDGEAVIINPPVKKSTTSPVFTLK